MSAYSDLHYNLKLQLYKIIDPYTDAPEQQVLRIPPLSLVHQVSLFCIIPRHYENIPHLIPLWHTLENGIHVKKGMIIVSY